MSQLSGMHFNYSYMHTPDERWDAVLIINRSNKYVLLRSIPRIRDFCVPGVRRSRRFFEHEPDYPMMRDQLLIEVIVTFQRTKKCSRTHDARRNENLHTTPSRYINRYCIVLVYQLTRPTNRVVQKQHKRKTKAEPRQS